MAYAGDGGRPVYNNRLVIDACRPYDRLKTFPAVVGTSEADAARLRERYPALFGPDGKISPAAETVDVAEP
jgi:hypothetical protein